MEEIPKDLLQFRSLSSCSGLLFRHCVEVEAVEKRVVYNALDVSRDKAMTGGGRQQHGWDLLVVQSIRLFVDRLAGFIVSLGDTAIENVLELAQQIFGHVLADGIGTHH